ncbi:MAG: UDP-N-acetylmuramoyl-L-alanyl-D-glutamate--2,6-diaminopimelate ligase [Herbinix sp.]|jgi:UDP-N-acetylmuramoyl-L-alanyl-D-glutamate--2,6-diaminopimelate ligase|nr:UDP-N-acetylmuramoyl-L-alanyl-D-glutamate--2,6-diaminopimelate ligase [Herbinix sp.]
MKPIGIPLHQLLTGVNYNILLQGSLQEVNDLVIHSKLVQEGSMYIAVKGDKTDGHQFITEAYEKGAKFILINKENLPSIDLSLYNDITIAAVSNTRECLSYVVNLFYSDPSEHFSLIGVTGTNGKTSVTTIASRVFQAFSYNTGLIGTINNYINQTVLDIEKTNPTTPDCIELGKIMNLFVEEKVDVALMEVSSMALKTHRVDCCHFATAVFTNLSPEHLDNHKSMEDYVQSKLRLFDLAKQAVVNMDDAYSNRVLERCKGKVITYGIINHHLCDLYAKDIHYSGDSVHFTIVHQENEMPITIHIPCEFAVYNTLAVIGISIMHQLPLQRVFSILQEEMKVEGRYDVIEGKQPFTVIIDYAHTPAALENLLTSVRKNPSYRRVITVFGCGGNRDKSKRSVMGSISQRLSDITIITSDNPRFEDPNVIIADILNGMEKEKENYHILVDRKEAIEYAIAVAKADDVVLIAGKGHEKTQECNGRATEFNDKTVVEQAIRKLRF